MIQFNLLPDIKLDYIKAQRSARLVLSVSVLVSVAAIGLLLILLSIDGLQKKHLSDLSRDITTETAKLQGEPQINKILTVQNQLNSLTTLHSQKPAVARLFSYLDELTPNQVSINSMQIDFGQHTVNITGSADALSSVNQFVDTLKFTKYKVTSSSSGSSSDGTPTSAFSDVVLSNFGLNTSQQKLQPNAQANYTVTFSYDPNIFDNTLQVNLAVPSLTTTRSQLDKPNDLFTAAPTPSPTTPSTSSGTGGQ